MKRSKGSPAQQNGVAKMRSGEKKSSSIIVGGEGNPSRPDSESSVEHREDLSVRWRAPKSPMELAGQANEVATMVLNDAIDLDKARVYSAVIRVAAQALTAETTRARFLRTEPNLAIPRGPKERGKP